MQRLLVIAGSVLALTACSGMNGMMKDHHSNYGKLAKIAKQEDAQFALLVTRKGDLAVVDVATGELVEPGKERTKTSQDEMSGNDKRVSDEEFAEIQRRFDRAITLKATKGSVCMTIVSQPPGRQWTICSPPYPQWW